MCEGIKEETLVAATINSDPRAVYEVQPLTDPRWDEFLERHPRASVFHTTGWLEALRQTYGYEPIAYTTTPPGANLRNAVLFCRVQSWLTGPRLVSLPFSDHCEPLVDDAADFQDILANLKERSRQNKWRYFEIRLIDHAEEPQGSFHSTYSYLLHQLDLSPNLETLFRGFHKDSTQRKIRRAEREGLTYQEGRSEALLDDFYRLFLLTRRRHQLPPQPRNWFLNLTRSLGEAIKIRVAFKGQRAVAAVMTLRYKDTLVYKYGCSDARFNSLGGMHLLFWRSIQDAKKDGLRTFDLGRSDREGSGLITFKDRWGATRSTLTYSRYTRSARSLDKYKTTGDWTLRIAKRVFPLVPDSILAAAGQMLYKHIG
jgi:CelD/BcsL family acetyltransferase involved in cellulose biosynthesis